MSFDFKYTLNLKFRKFSCILYFSVWQVKIKDCCCFFLSDLVFFSQWGSLYDPTQKFPKFPTIISIYNFIFVLNLCNHIYDPKWEIFTKFQEEINILTSISSSLKIEWGSIWPQHNRRVKLYIIWEAHMQVDLTLAKNSCMKPIQTTAHTPSSKRTVQHCQLISCTGQFTHRYLPWSSHILFQLCSVSTIQLSTQHCSIC